MKTPYGFLPFRFERRGKNILLINDVGDHHFLSNEIFQKFIEQKLDAKNDDLLDLQSKFMTCIENLPQNIELLATRYRTKKRNLYESTALHMFVITQRCNQKCAYCHASSAPEDAGTNYDMDFQTARRCVDLVFASPSPHIKIEFQGGEPTLNFPTIIEIVTYAKEINQEAKKNLEFVICTNLTRITEDHVKFIKNNQIIVSTSLDGPRDLHNRYRRFHNGTGTYDIVIENLNIVRNEIGYDNVSALMTTTPYNIKYLKEVIDEYIRQSFSSIFIRMINPYGAAAHSSREFGYSESKFVSAYRNALEYIINLNLSGISISEEYATLMLFRIMTPFSDGFVDLQSPSGAGIGGAIYDINGDVYIADEARMLAKMNGDKTFCLGNVHQNSWKDMFCGEKLKNITEATCIESLPGCAWCVYQPYCGTDPIRNYIQFGRYDAGGKRSEACNKNKAIFDLLFEYLEEGRDDIQDVFWSWITNRNVSNVAIN